MSRPLAKARILIIEDVEEMRELVCRLIESLPGMEVSGAVGNAFDARMELSRRRPDLALLDEVLPGESGVDFLQELLRDGVPVILLTGMENAAHPIAEGALGRLVKPGWDDFEAAKGRFEQQIREALRRP